MFILPNIYFTNLYSTYDHDCRQAPWPWLERSKVINHSMLQLQMPNSSLFALLQHCNSQAKNLNFCPGLGTLDGVQSDIDKKGDVEALSSQIHTYKWKYKNKHTNTKHTFCFLFAFLQHCSSKVKTLKLLSAAWNTLRFSKRNNTNWIEWMKCWGENVQKLGLYNSGDIKIQGIFSSVTPLFSTKMKIG